MDPVEYKPEYFHYEGPNLTELFEKALYDVLFKHATVPTKEVCIKAIMDALEPYLPKPVLKLIIVDSKQTVEDRIERRAPKIFLEMPRWLAEELGYPVEEMESSRDAPRTAWADVGVIEK